MDFASSKSRSKSLDFECDDSKFLFKNRKFISIEAELSAVRVHSATSSSQYSGDSDYLSTEWGSFSEDNELEVSLMNPRLT